MNARIEAIVAQVQSLEPDERVTLLDALNELVTPPDDSWQSAWTRESEDRLAAFEQGRIGAEDFDVVMARLRKEYLAG